MVGFRGSQEDILVAVAIANAVVQDMAGLGHVVDSEFPFEFTAAQASCAEGGAHSQMAEPQAQALTDASTRVAWTFAPEINAVELATPSLIEDAQLTISRVQESDVLARKCAINNVFRAAMVQHIAMSVPSTWDLSVKLGTICQSVKMVILRFSQSKTFTGEIMYNSLSTGATPTRINGTLRGSELRWRLAMLEYRGKLCRGGTQISTGSIWSVSPFYAGRLFLGTFTARRLPSPPGEIHGSTWCPSLNISDDMLDVLYRNGASPHLAV